MQIQDCVDVWVFFEEQHLSIGLIKLREERRNIWQTLAFLMEPLMSVQEVIELQRDLKMHRMKLVKLFALAFPQTSM